MCAEDSELRVLTFFARPKSMMLTWLARFPSPIRKLSGLHGASGQAGHQDGERLRLHCVPTRMRVETHPEDGGNFGAVFCC